MSNRLFKLLEALLRHETRCLLRLEALRHPNIEPGVSAHCLRRCHVVGDATSTRRELAAMSSSRGP